VLAGYDESGGGNGYMPVDHSKALEQMGGQLSKALRASWLPRITRGWFFRAESFFSVARYQDKVNLEYIPGVPPGTPPDYLSHSHGEGFLRFFEERCQRQGIFIFDEPESALSPARQIEFLKLIRLMEVSQNCQVIMATHAPMLMAYPNARLLRLEVWARAGDHRRDLSLQDHARILRRPGGVRGSGDRGMITPPPVRPMLAQVSNSEAKAALYYGNRCKGFAPKGLFTHQRNVSGLNHRFPFPESEDCIFRFPTVFSLASGSDFWFPGMVSPDGETSSTLALDFSLGDCFSSCAGLAGSAA
jgi:predicted ATPase